MKKFKDIIKKSFNFFGYEVKKKNNDIKELSFDEILKKKIVKKNPVIVDIGANRGQSINRFLKLFDTPIIHSFEPISKEFDILKGEFGGKKNINLNNLAMGEKKETKFLNVTRKSENSSFNKINLGTDWIKARSKEYQVNEESYVDVQQKVSVDTLDAYAQDHDIEEIDILKIDTQGFEDKVLIGAQNLINENRIKFIQLELIFSEIYQNPLQIYDVEKTLIPRNYKLFSISNGGSLISYYIFQSDLIYVSSDIYEDFKRNSAYFNN